MTFSSLSQSVLPSDEGADCNKVSKMCRSCTMCWEAGVYTTVIPTMHRDSKPPRHQQTRHKPKLPRKIRKVTSHFFVSQDASTCFLGHARHDPPNIAHPFLLRTVTCQRPLQFSNVSQETKCPFGLWISIVSNKNRVRVSNGCCGVHVSWSSR